MAKARAFARQAGQAKENIDPPPTCAFSTPDSLSAVLTTICPTRMPSSMDSLEKPAEQPWHDLRM
jgi:hypothetical protein